MRKNIAPPISINGIQAPAYVPVPKPIEVNVDAPPSHDSMGGGPSGMANQP
jgi:hypothetical protein